MKFGLTKDLCYFAGLCARYRHEENSQLGIRTTNHAVIERFVKLALSMGVGPSKILVEENEKLSHVYFFNSKLARQVKQLREKENYYFRPNSKFAQDYVAGMFDASGHKSSAHITMGNLDNADCFMLENLGIHTKGGVVQNPGALLKLIRGDSIVAKGF